MSRQGDSAPASRMAWGTLLLFGLLVSMKTSVIQALPKDERSCPPSCGPFGECVPCSATDNCTGERCRCDDNYAGDDCSLQVDFCPAAVDTEGSATTCLNGGRCVLKEIMEDPSGFEAATEVWRCDCTYAVGDAAVAAYAGSQCEFPATTSCLVGGADSDYAFCVNGGDCVKKIIRGEEHPGCVNCLGFVGRHCQYEEGKAPPEELAAARKDIEDDSNGMKPGFVILLVLVAGVVLGGLALFITQRGSKSDAEATVAQDVPTDLKLEETGGKDASGTAHEDDGEHKEDRPQVV